jgi:hypothetical protein
MGSTSGSGFLSGFWRPAERLISPIPAYFSMPIVAGLNATSAAQDSGTLA